MCLIFRSTTFNNKLYTDKLVKRALHITLICMAAVIAVGLLIAGICCGRAGRPDTVCTVLRYDITDADKRLYLSDKELNGLLRAQDAYPIGKPLSKVSLQRIEDVVQTNPMVRTVQCYTNPQGEIYVRLTQREPLLKVITADDSYIVDTDRKRMPLRESIKDTMLTATGKVGLQMATHSIADFAEWLRDDAYWRTRIKYIDVRTPHYVRLLPANADSEIIVLGDLDGYEDKLRKLRTFYEGGGEMVRAKQYKELDLRFEGQVVGRK